MSATNIPGVLAAFSYGCVSGSKRDPLITKEVLDDKNAGDGAGAWFNKLFPPKACGRVNSFTRLKSHLSHMRGYFYSTTFVYEDQIWRILPEKRIPAFKQTVEQDGQETAKQLLEEFIAELPDLKAKAAMPKEQGGRGDAYKEDDYPSVDEIREKFKYAVDYRPIPNGSSLNPALMAEAIEKLNAMNEQRLKDANAALVQRFLDPLQKLAEQLMNPEKKKIKTVLESLLEIADLVPTLEMAGNQQLITLAQGITETFKNVTPELLRKDESLQKLVGESVNSWVGALSSFGEIGSRKFA